MFTFPMDIGLLAPSFYQRIISGRARGIAPAAIRLLLRLAEVPYALVVRVRNNLYDQVRLRKYWVDVPVVSVGNITLGGTGKTPLVEWIARWFRRNRLRVAIISRGYGAHRGKANDEGLVLRARLPDVPHLQRPDRVGAALEAINRFGCQVIVLDDAFQHRRIGRDLDIVTLDALEPFGHEHLLPRGTLREPLAGLRRAHLIVLTRADAVEPARRQAIRSRVEGLAPLCQWAEVACAPTCLVRSDGDNESLAAVRQSPVAAFCGIGNPVGFRHTLQQCGVALVAFKEFPDHCRYTPARLDALERWAAALDVKAVLCTEKDLVKIGCDQLGGKPLWAVRIKLRFLSGEHLLTGMLQALVLERNS